MKSSTDDPPGALGKPSISSGNTDDQKRFWENSKCLVCQSKHFTEDAWQKHMKTETHIQRVRVYEFLKSSENYVRTSTASLPATEAVTQDKLLGVECIHQFKKEDLLGFWLCSVCYVVSTDFCGIIKHLTSNVHRVSFISLFHTDRKPRATSVKALTAELDRLADELGERTDTATLEVFSLKTELSDALTAIGLAQVAKEKTPVKLDIAELQIASEEKLLVYCQTCNSVMKVDDFGDGVKKTWNDHKLAHKHKKGETCAKYIQALDNASHYVDASCSVVTNYDKCKHADKSYFFHKAWLCGLDSVVEHHRPSAKPPTFIFCQLCCERMAAMEYELCKHVTSETHALKFMHKNYPLDVLEIETASTLQRKKMLDDFFESHSIDPGRIRVFAPDGLASKPQTDDTPVGAPEDDDIEVVQVIKKAKSPPKETENKSATAANNTSPKDNSLTKKGDHSSGVQKHVEQKLSASDLSPISSQDQTSADEFLRESGEPLIGVKHVYVVTCVAHPSVRTFFCHLCSSWNCRQSLCKHLTSDQHRKAYLDRWYKMYAQNVHKYTNEAAKSSVLKQYAQQIWKNEGLQKMQFEAKFHVTAYYIKTVWSDLAKYLTTEMSDHSHRNISSTTPPPGMDVSTPSFVHTRPPAQVTHRSREPLPPGMESSQSSQLQNRKQRHDDMSWDERAALFLSKIGDERGAGKVRKTIAQSSSHTPSSSRRRSRSRSPRSTRRQRSLSRERRSRRSRDAPRSRSRERRRRRSPSPKRAARSPSPYFDPTQERGHRVSSVERPLLYDQPQSDLDLRQLQEHALLRQYTEQKPSLLSPTVAQPPSLPVMGSPPLIMPDLSRPPPQIAPPNIEEKKPETKPPPSGEQQLLQKLLGTTGAESTEELLLKLLLEERKKQQQQEEQQKALLTMLTESLQPKQPKAVFDYSHGDSRPAQSSAANVEPVVLTAYTSRHSGPILPRPPASSAGPPAIFGSTVPPGPVPLVPRGWLGSQAGQEQFSSRLLPENWKPIDPRERGFDDQTEQGVPVRQRTVEAAPVYPPIGRRQPNRQQIDTEVGRFYMGFGSNQGVADMDIE